MEKEHKSKHKTHKVKVRPHVQETHTEKVIVKKPAVIPAPSETLSVKKEIRPPKVPDNTLGKFPKEKKVKTNVKLPINIFIVGLFCLSFAIGGIFAKIVPSVIESFNKNREQASNEVVPEATPSQTPNENIPEETARVLKTQPPVISARAYGIYELKDGDYREVTSKNPQTILPMASVTKVMTAIIALEEYDLDKPVAIPAKCVGLNGSSVGFRANDVFTLQDLLYGLLVKSGADAACAIANIDNEADFIVKMNEHAQAMGMEQTKFTNAIGFDNSDAHVSDINDLKILVTHALKYSTFRKIVGTGEYTLVSKSSGAPYRIRNTNELLFSIPGTVGIKTGYTDSAGECLTYLYQNKDQEILIVILGSADRFGDTSKLLEWAKTELKEMNEPDLTPSTI